MKFLIEYQNTNSLWTKPIVGYNYGKWYPYFTREDVCLANGALKKTVNSKEKQRSSVGLDAAGCKLSQ